MAQKRAHASPGSEGFETVYYESDDEGPQPRRLRPSDIDSESGDGGSIQIESDDDEELMKKPKKIVDDDDESSLHLSDLEAMCASDVSESPIQTDCEYDSESEHDSITALEVYSNQQFVLFNCDDSTAQGVQNTLESLGTETTVEICVTAQMPRSPKLNAVVFKILENDVETLKEFCSDGDDVDLKIRQFNAGSENVTRWKILGLVDDQNLNKMLDNIELIYDILSHQPLVPGFTINLTGNHIVKREVIAGNLVSKTSFADAIRVNRNLLEKIATERMNRAQRQIYKLRRLN